MSEQDIASGQAADRPVRWVQFTTPVFVRVQANEDGWDADITKVVVVTDPAEMNLALDERGHELVYNSDGDRVSPDERLDIDGFRTAVHVARRTAAWPAKDFAFSGGWDEGEDPREIGFEMYEDDPVDDDLDDEDDLDEDGA